MKNATMTVEELVAKVRDGADAVVRDFRTDLDYDVQDIHRYPGVPFIHVAQEMGTHIIPMFPYDHDYWPTGTVRYLLGKADKYYIAKDRLRTAEYLSKTYPDALWRYYNGLTLKRIKPSKAVDIVEWWLHDTLYTWKST